MDETVYAARHGFEGQLLVDLLRQAGLDAVLHGADLIAGAGELPALGLVQVRVPTEQLAAAQALMLAWERGDFAIPDEHESL